MTTTNNHLTLIDQVGGIEKAKMIVEGAPDGATIISLATLEYFRELVNPLYENEPYRFLRIQITEDGLLRHSARFAPIISPINLNDLRTAIEHHYYGRSEAEELAAYAELSQEIEGVTTFDEWWKVNELKYDYVFPASRDAFKAGQESKQAEIDRLEEWNSNQARSIKTYQGEDEDLKVLLQKLIDDEYTTMRPSMAYEIQKALRGDNA